MQRLDLTLPTSAENLALDEALLDECEAAIHGDLPPVETLRLWEPRQPFVVLGRASRIAEEVDVAACERDGVSILRRHSGGAAVVAGPGCLMYALVLDQRIRPQLRSIAAAHAFVLETLVAALESLAPRICRRGTSDLAVADGKVSGNSLRCKADCLLYHGTLLYDFRLDWIARWLRLPPRQPAYRGGRSHVDFVRNLTTPGVELRTRLAAAFAAVEQRSDWPRAAVERLVREKYGADAWNRGR
jgi:lipoate-protein ligase A